LEPIEVVGGFAGAGTDISTEVTGAAQQSRGIAGALRSQPGFQSNPGLAETCTRFRSGRGGFGFPDAGDEELCDIADVVTQPA
jgi:hypothetical protein